VRVTADGTPKLVDFGIAKLLEAGAGAAVTRTLHFTPLYASPEQIRGEAVNTSTDVFGLGLLLYELATGGPAFAAAGGGTDAQARAVLEDEVRVPLTVPADLAAIIGMALRKAPDRRYATADQMAEDVRRYLDGRPVRAHPETWWYQTRKFVGRHVVGVGLAGAAVLTLVALTAVALRQARIADDQRARAEQVTGFVTGFLGATPTGPDWALQNKGVSLRVVELADDIGVRIGGGELAAQPEAEATLRSVLAMTYYQMGEIAKAESHAERAIALYDEVYPRNDPRRFSVELILASVENSLGRFAAAEARTQDVAARWRDMPPAAASVYTSQLGIAQRRRHSVRASPRWSGRWAPTIPASGWWRRISRWCSSNAASSRRRHAGSSAPRRSRAPRSKRHRCRWPGRW
jgi:serine/threonine-protein kinase